MSEKDFKNVIIKDLNDEYALGKLNDFKVIIMKNNNNINGTKLCDQINKKIGTHKRFDNWLRNESTKELFKCVYKSPQNRGGDNCVKIMNGPNEYRGTYIHKDLAIHLASWISPQYAIKVAKIIWEYNAEELYNEKRKLELALDEKEYTIKDLKRDIKKLEEKNKKIYRASKKLLNKLESTNDKLERTENKVDDLKTQNNRLEDKITKLCETNAPKSALFKDHHCFVIINTNEEDELCYRAIKVKNKDKNRTISNYEGCNIVLDIKYNPNPINLWDRIKEKLQDNIIVRRSSFGLDMDYSEKELIRDVKRINNEKYNI